MMEIMIVSSEQKDIILNLIVVRIETVVDCQEDFTDDEWLDIGVELKELRKFLDKQKVDYRGTTTTMDEFYRLTD